MNFLAFPLVLYGAWVLTSSLWNGRIIFRRSYYERESKPAVFWWIFALYVVMTISGLVAVVARYVF
jgi:hypothetical protein